MLEAVPIAILGIIVIAGIFIFVLASSPQHSLWRPKEHSELARMVEVSQLAVSRGEGDTWSIIGVAENKAPCDLLAVLLVFRPRGFEDTECFGSIEQLPQGAKAEFQIEVLIPESQVQKPYTVVVAEARRKMNESAFKGPGPSRDR